MLISTIAPREGGIPQMTRFLAGTLRERDLEPVLGYYEPYSVDPSLSVPSFRLGQRIVGTRPGTAIDGYETHAVGAWLPELEFTHYLPIRAWHRLMDGCRYHVSVSGSCLAAAHYAISGRRFLAWVASPWWADRKDRIARFPWPRRTLDRLLNRPVLKRLERYTLRRGTILPLSRYTGRGLDAAARRPVVHAPLPMPVDPERFFPDHSRHVPARIGFVGRYLDPRKNASLLLGAFERVRRSMKRAELFLVGDRPDASINHQVETRGLVDSVAFIPYLSADELRPMLQSFDLFVIPSHQEGLCIAALEAMACGVPVVATRCGGPEEFVLDGETGFLVSSDPDALAETILGIIGDSGMRQRLSRGAQNAIRTGYHPETAKSRFWQAFDNTYPA